MNFTKNMISLNIIMLSCMLLSSCFGYSPKNTFDVVEIELKSTQNISKYNFQLFISEPVALKALDSENIVVRYSPTEIQYLINSQWSDKLPRMVQSKLIASFENDGRLLAISKPSQGMIADYQISSTIRSFEIDLLRNKAVIDISVKLIGFRNGIVKAQKIFHIEEQLEKDNKMYFIKSLNLGFARISSEIIKWTLLSLSTSE
ncbi:ABC-type transport auxiliary lipoprotein family protein [Candidatus Liberibacter sp.]|uniref:ABC-type transport auxiliary lipoprotein family protein n=1 Tax=Candidatus Liberibacter sp. TaxID=34022 RepID=UPI002174EC20|nr:ABC-type transport auxiliary lipoprotein family protein [Candidatus Liberibacter sp.]